MGFHAKRYRGAPALLSAEAITIPSALHLPERSAMSGLSATLAGLIRTAPASIP
jgi:hypothetical protein